MSIVEYSMTRNNFKDYCNKASDLGEIVFVTRGNNKNAVLMSIDKYNELEKAAHNNEYLTMVDEGIAQLEASKGREHELIELDN